MKKIDKYLDKFETWSFVILLTVMTVVVFLQVIFRYVIHSSLPWSEELSRDCLIFVTFIGVSAGLKAGTHTSIDFLILVLPDRCKYAVQLLGQVLIVLFSVAFFVISARLAYMILVSGQQTQALGIPTWISYAALPLGLFGGIFRSVENLVRFLRGENEAPAEEQEGAA